ncbi:hypothetical protein CBD41_04245 [bacterium TMED181]|nr:MAG: hypothetical protein CBD41_04245 [bacterium TMED181]
MFRAGSSGTNENVVSGQKHDSPATPKRCAAVTFEQGSPDPTGTNIHSLDSTSQQNEIKDDELFVLTRN